MAVAEDPVASRARACLWGGAVGDALGGRYEFVENAAECVRQDKHMYGGLMILGEGIHGLAVGQVTDDTELALSLARSIVRDRDYSPANVATAYLRWYRSDPFDVGKTTRRALANAAHIGHVLQNSLFFNMDSLSNGCLMRVAPLAVLGVKLSTERLLSYAALDCMLTNPNPETVNAVQAYVILLRTLLIGNAAPFSDVRMKAIFDAREVAGNSIGAILKKYTVPMDTTQQSLLLRDLQTRPCGLFSVALEWSLYELLYGNSFAESMERIICGGGDTDTNACIAGAVLGAYHGVGGNSGVPQHWLGAVRDCHTRRQQTFPTARTDDLDQLADALLTCFSE